MASVCFGASARNYSFSLLRLNYQQLQKVLDIGLWTQRRCLPSGGLFAYHSWRLTIAFPEPWQLTGGVGWTKYMRRKGERQFEIHHQPGMSRVEHNCEHYFLDPFWVRSFVDFWGELFFFFLVSTHTLSLSLLQYPPKSLWVNL